MDVMNDLSSVYGVFSLAIKFFTSNYYLKKIKIRTLLLVFLMLNCSIVLNVVNVNIDIIIYLPSGYILYHSIHAAVCKNICTNSKSVFGY